MTPNCTIYRWHTVANGESITQAPIPAYSQRAALNQMARVAIKSGARRIAIHWKTNDGFTGQFEVIR